MMNPTRLGKAMCHLEVEANGGEKTISPEKHRSRRTTGRGEKIKRANQ